MAFTRSPVRRENFQTFSLSSRHGHGAVHALNLRAEGGKVLRIVLRGVKPLQQRQRHGQHRRAAAIVDFASASMAASSCIRTRDFVWKNRLLTVR